MFYNFYIILKNILKIKSFSYIKTIIYNIIIFYFKISKYENFKIRNVDNLYIKFKNKKFYVGHFDVVHADLIKWKKNPFEAKILKKKILNRGIIDMKTSIVCFLYCNLNFNILLTNDEESLSVYGIQYLINILKKRKKKIFFFLGGEPTSLKYIGDYIKISRRGSLNLKIIFFGKEKHSAYIGKNIIYFSIKIFFNIIKKYFNFSENIEITNILSSSKNLNIIPNVILINLNLRFNNILNINILKKKILFFLLKKNSYFTWNLSGIPFFSKKSFFLSKLFNSIYYIQNIKININFLGGTSDLRYCYYLNKYSNIIELGLINCSIHKINENSFFDDCIILHLIYKKTFGIK